MTDKIRLDIIKANIEREKLNDKETDEFKNYISYSGTPATVFIKDGEERTAIKLIVETRK